MTTKPPAKTAPFPENSVEKVVYDSIEAITTCEPNDRARLGYSIMRWLDSKSGTLEDVIFQSHIRLEMPVPEAVEIIRKSLAGKGISLPL